MCLVMASAVQRLPQEGGDDGATGSKKTDLQQHLQAMFALLPQHHILKEAVRLESVHKGRVRYLAVVSCCGSLNDEEETCVLGFDCVGEKACTLGLVMCLYADSSLTLDGDGGFSLCSAGSQHVFKPVSVHVLWAVIQSLHKACARAQKLNHYAGGTTHRWMDSYRITSDRSCLNEWHYLPDVESRRPSSPLDQKADRERLIRTTLKEVMMALDLDVVTSKDIRRRVEEELKLDLTDHKSFLDQEMLTILGQMDGASKIFDDLYLGSEWNASNLEELERNGIGHILNVTREIDNFFPDQFDYLNVRVYDDEATELLKHWDRTFKYIRRATEKGSRVLVHCKMGVSRSASVVIAYAMKARDWNLPEALEHVKKRRACVKPNASFMHQLEIYAGILDASRHRHNHLWRSKSETNLQSTNNDSTRTVQLPARPFPTEKKKKKKKPLPLPPLPPAPLPIIVNDSQTNSCCASVDKSLQDEDSSNRPKSWSPDDSLAESYFPSTPSATVVDRQETEQEQQESDASHRSICVSLRVPCSNGRTYSVSQNRAVQLESSPPPPPPLPPSSFSSLELDAKSLSSEFIECFNPCVLDQSPELAGSVGLPRVGSVKDRIYELETAAAAASSSTTRAGLILNLAWPNGSEGISPGDTPLSAPVTSSGSENGSRDLFSSRVDRVFENEERRQSADGSMKHQAPNQYNVSQPVQQPEQEQPPTSSSAPLRLHSWGSVENRCDSNWMSSYASDPSLLSHVDIQPPSGLVRMQREALLEKASQPSTQQRRSLPDDTAPVTTPAPQLNRSVSDTAGGGGSVMRLRRELEAKAAFPLTGSFAPPPLVVAAFAAAATSPTRTNRPRPSSTIKAAGRKSLQRKRSLSLERVSFSVDALEDWNRAAQAAADEVDLNVKLLVGMFETPPSRYSATVPTHRPSNERRPRGWSESGAHPRLTGQPQSQRRCQSPIIIDSPPTLPTNSTTPPIRQCPGLQQQQQQRKPYGKTHPLDRLVVSSSSRQPQQQKLAQQPVFGTM